MTGPAAAMRPLLVTTRVACRYSRKTTSAHRKTQRSLLAFCPRHARYIALNVNTARGATVQGPVCKLADHVTRSQSADWFTATSVLLFWFDPIASNRGISERSETNSYVCCAELCHTKGWAFLCCLLTMRSQDFIGHSISILSSSLLSVAVLYSVLLSAKQFSPFTKKTQTSF